MKNKTKWNILFFCMIYLIIYLFCVGSVNAVIPNNLNIQGILQNASGNYYGGTQNVSIRIYDVFTGGVNIYEQIQDLDITNGKFNTLLENIGLNFDVPYYIGVAVSTDLEMSQRVNLTSVPYAFRAKWVENITNDNTTMTNYVNTQIILAGTSIINNISSANDTLVDYIDRLNSSQQAYVDTNKVDKAGDTMTGPLSMGNNNITNISNLYLGTSEADHTFCFYEGGDECGRQIRWDDSSNYYYFDDTIEVSGSVSGGTIVGGSGGMWTTGDISTTGTGDDFWLGNTAQANAKFRAYASGGMNARYVNVTGINSSTTMQQNDNEVIDISNKSWCADAIDNGTTLRNNSGAYFTTLGIGRFDPQDLGHIYSLDADGNLIIETDSSTTTRYEAGLILRGRNTNNQRSWIIKTEQTTSDPNLYIRRSDAGAVEETVITLHDNGLVNISNFLFVNGSIISIDTLLTSSYKLDIKGNVRIDANDGGDLFLDDIFIRAEADEKTLDVSGNITATETHTVVDTYEDAGTDDLNYIHGGGAGRILIIRSSNSNRDVTLKDGVGNLELAGDFTLTNINDAIMLINRGGASLIWVEISRSDNS